MAGRGKAQHGVGADCVAPLELPPETRSAGLARRYIRDCLTSLGRLDLLECAELGVDELVANVCLHAHTPLVLTVHGTANRPVRIEVTDYSPSLPVRQDAQTYSLGGRGLTLLDACGVWGLGDAPAGGGKTIWFEPGAAMTGLFDP
jgi:anti-sigma regulatory factor (Ser/Thr protein kinase)